MKTKFMKTFNHINAGNWGILFNVIDRLGHAVLESNRSLHLSFKEARKCIVCIHPKALLSNDKSRPIYYQTVFQEE